MNAGWNPLCLPRPRRGSSGLRYTGITMPRFNQNEREYKMEWFDKLPKKLRIILLLLVTIGVAALQLWMGWHSAQTGKPIVLNNVTITAAESFGCCAAWLAIFGGLFAVLMGWAKSGKGDDL